MIRKATPEEITIIQSIARTTWPVTYGNILSSNQLQYMLENFYSTSSLLEQFHQQDFYLFTENENFLGFCAFENKRNGITHLHKIYVLPQAQGKSVGSQFLAFMEQKARELGQKKITLNVNRFNKAKDFYEKLGFTVDQVVDIPIGEGYWMEDYIMQKTLD